MVTNLIDTDNKKIFIEGFVSFPSKNICTNQAFLTAI